MGTWTNNDGLKLSFGTDKTIPNVIGEYRTDGPKRMVEIRFDYTALPIVASNSVVVRDKTALPKGASVEAVEIFCYTDFDSAGDAMTLNVGTVDMDGTSNAVVDSLVVAATQTELIAGGTNTAGWVGALVAGAALTTPKYVTWEVDAAAASAGEAAIRIYYSVA